MGVLPGDLGLEGLGDVSRGRKLLLRLIFGCGRACGRPAAPEQRHWPPASAVKRQNRLAIAEPFRATRVHSPFAQALPEPLRARWTGLYVHLPCRGRKYKRVNGRGCGVLPGVEVTLMAFVVGMSAVTS